MMINSALNIVVLASLLCTSFYVGSFVTEEGIRLDKANIEGLCKPEPRFNAYIAETNEGWHCFKENTDNGKLSRSAIVL